MGQAQPTDNAERAKRGGAKEDRVINKDYATHNLGMKSKKVGIMMTSFWSNFSRCIFKFGSGFRSSSGKAASGAPPTIRTSKAVDYYNAYGTYDDAELAKKDGWDKCAALFGAQGGGGGKSKRVFSNPYHGLLGRGAHSTPADSNPTNRAAMPLPPAVVCHSSAMAEPTALSLMSMVAHSGPKSDAAIEKIHLSRGEACWRAGDQSHGLDQALWHIAALGGIDPVGCLASVAPAWNRRTYYKICNKL